ncbi:hypothetical protein DFR30_0151 [Thiogranum longum]|uniref:Uncharacterized protein n=1 Tax=Thiogranum longum TaxID=1537524 RepID=A0A4R1HIA2_9GAMM|nr:hypothetical protein [Thiogranum longum]TCK16932.1 hypothetical protein DFR30_0151 [Thiogranum longum]
MLHFGAFQVKLMGVVATFDVVTFYGLICAVVFTTGIVIATRIEKSNHAQPANS